MAHSISSQLHNMQERFCPYCGGPIPFGRNMNSVYCCYECYYLHKKSEAAIANRKEAEERELLRNDEIAYDLYFLYKSDSYISAAELIKKKFNWSIDAGEILVNGIRAKKLIRCSYTLFINQTVKLWKQ